MQEGTVRSTSSIISSRLHAYHQFHSEFRVLFSKIRQIVDGHCVNPTSSPERHLNSQGTSDDEEDLAEARKRRRDLRFQSVAAFAFLRFLVPAILNPHLFGLTEGLPPNDVQKSLKNIGRVIQALANLNTVRTYMTYGLIVR